MKTNIMGTYYLMKAAVEAGVKTVGDDRLQLRLWALRLWRHGRLLPGALSAARRKHPSACVNSYSWSKFAGEDLLHTFTRAFGIRTYITRPAHICDEAKRRDMAATVKPATEWSGGLWGWVASEDLAELQLRIQQAANDLPLHDVFVGNNLDTEALEPTMELIERFRPELLPVTHGLTGYDALFSSAHVEEMLGWLPTAVGAVSAHALELPRGHERRRIYPCAARRRLWTACSERQAGQQRAQHADQTLLLHRDDAQPQLARGVHSRVLAAYAHRPLFGVGWQRREVDQLGAQRHHQ